MSAFTRPLKIEYIGNGYYRVDETYEYHIGFEGSKNIVRVVETYLTDLDSSPWGTRWLVRMNTNHYQADVGHDILYTIGRIHQYVAAMGGRIEPTDWIQFVAGGPKVFLADYPVRSRKECDDIYLEMMETLNNSPYTKIPKWRRLGMYRCVRIFGGWDMRPKKVFKRVYAYNIQSLKKGTTHS